VTGAGHGLGRAYARELASRGATVVCNDLDGDRAGAVAQEIIDEGGTAIADRHSVADAADGAAIVENAVEHFGRIDVVVNNAGQLRNAAFAELPTADVEAVIATHLTGAFHVTQPAFRSMQAAGYGRIVFTSSAALFGGSWQASYAAAKSGVLGLCRVVASEGALHGIRANAILPMALTGGLGHDGPPPFPPDELAETIDVITPLARRLTVENVAPLVAYLASRECTVSGRAFSVGAGHVAEVFVGLARGWSTDDELTPERIASQLDAICDRTHSTVPGSMNEATRAIGAVVLPSVPPSEEEP
jgi:NAD(P)-dependent dehydrogenase (short-subunit alcohol dehydrogenase family)